MRDFFFYVVSDIPADLLDELHYYNYHIPAVGLIAIWSHEGRVLRYEVVGSTPEEIKAFFRRLMAEDLGITHLPVEWRERVIDAKLDTALGGN